MKTGNLSILIFLFIISSTLAHAQFAPRDCSCIDRGYAYFEIDSIEYFHTVNNDTIFGKIPSVNNYTGSVTEFRKKYQTSTSIMVYYDGIEKIEKVVHRPFFSIFKISEGNYIGGKETGLFTFYNKTDCYDYTIEYTEDSIIRKPVFCGGFKLVCTSDSSFCYGYLESQFEYDIHYICKNSICIFYLKGRESLILQCDQKDLEFNLYGFYFGNYNREIRKTLLIEESE